MSEFTLAPPCHTSYHLIRTKHEHLNSQPHALTAETGAAVMVEASDGRIQTAGDRELRSGQPDHSRRSRKGRLAGFLLVPPVWPQCGDRDRATDRQAWPDVSSAQTGQPHALHIMRGTRCCYAACLAPPWRRADRTLWLGHGQPPAHQIEPCP